MPQSPYLSTDPNAGEAVTPPPVYLSTDPNVGEEAAGTESGPMRMVKAFGRAVDPRPLLAGAKYLATTDPIQVGRDTRELVGGAVQTFRDALGREQAATADLTPAERFQRARGPSPDPSDPWEVAGTAVGLLAPGAALKAAKVGLTARAARQAAKLPQKAVGDMLLAIPQTQAAPYAIADWEVAKPWLNLQHKSAPIATTKGMREALDTSIGEIESHVSAIRGAFPTARIQPDIEGAVRKAFQNHPRGEALAKGLDELSDLPFNRALTLEEADVVRAQLNAENKAILKRNNYDVATARKTDPGFRAREVASEQLRDGIYGYLEERGVPGVRELRRDEGSLIKIRNAVSRHENAGGRPVAGTSPGAMREAAGWAAGRAVSVASGGWLSGEKVAGAVRGGRKLRDDIVSRIFSYADDRVPTLPAIPEAPPIRGELAAGAIPMQAAADGSYVRSVPATVAVSERKALPPARAIVTPPPADTSYVKSIPAAYGTPVEGWTQAKAVLANPAGGTLLDELLTAGGITGTRVEKIRKIDHMLKGRKTANDAKFNALANRVLAMLKETQ